MGHSSPLKALLWAVDFGQCPLPALVFHNDHVCAQLASSYGAKSTIRVFSTLCSLTSLTLFHISILNLNSGNVCCQQFGGQEICELKLIFCRLDESVRQKVKIQIISVTLRLECAQLCDKTKVTAESKQYVENKALMLTLVSLKKLKVVRKLPASVNLRTLLTKKSLQHRGLFPL